MGSILYEFDVLFIFIWSKSA